MLPSMSATRSLIHSTSITVPRISRAVMGAQPSTHAATARRSQQRSDPAMVVQPMDFQEVTGKRSRPKVTSVTKRTGMDLAWNERKTCADVSTLIDGDQVHSVIQKFSNSKNKYTPTKGAFQESTYDHGYKLQFKGKQVIKYSNGDEDVNRPPAANVHFHSVGLNGKDMAAAHVKYGPYDYSRIYGEEAKALYDKILAIPAKRWV